jgi:hypothetical protein
LIIRCADYSPLTETLCQLHRSQLTLSDCDYANASDQPSQLVTSGGTSDVNCWNTLKGLLAVANAQTLTDFSTHASVTTWRFLGFIVVAATIPSSGELRHFQIFLDRPFQSPPVILHRLFPSLVRKPASAPVLLATVQLWRDLCKSQHRNVSHMRQAAQA